MRGTLWQLLKQWLSAWVRDPHRGRQPFLEGQRVHILCRQLYYLCFVRVLDGGSLGYSGLL